MPQREARYWAQENTGKRIECIRSTQGRVRKPVEVDNEEAVDHAERPGIMVQRGKDSRRWSNFGAGAMSALRAPRAITPSGGSTPASRSAAPVSAASSTTPSGLCEFQRGGQPVRFVG